jgi:hypothetical protein
MVYVDDLIIVARSRELIDEVKASLEKRFSMKHQGDIVQFLGMTITRDRANRTLTIDQTIYAKAVVAELLEAQAKESDIPGIPSVRLRLLPDGEMEPIQDVVGKLRYLADRTRPDILAAVNELGSGAAKPTPEHLRAAKRVLRYLKGTVESRLVLGGRQGLIPLGYCDASYTADGDSKSQYGYSLHLHGSGASVVKGKTSTTIPHSPCEAEVKAMDEITKEVFWLRVLLKEAGFEQLGPTVVYSDSTAGIDQVGAYKNSSKARHYCRDLNFIRAAIADGVVRFEHISGDLNRSDALTKNLGYDKFSRFARLLMRGEE